MPKPRFKDPKNVADPVPAPAPKTHTALSPSNADRWLNCPGSVALCATCPKPDQSEHASEGETAHALLEKCLKNPKLDPVDCIGEVLVPSNGIEVDEEMVEAVVFARDYILAELQKGGVLFTEQQVEIFPGISGTLDACVIREFNTIVIFDFKYGKGVVVKAVDNPQMLMYLLGILKNFDALSLKLVILQPRVEYQVSVWDVPEGYMDTFKIEVERRIALTKEDNATISAGKWCKFCNAKVICPQLRQDISDNLPAIPGKEILFPDVKGLPVPTILKILEYRDRVDSFLDAVFAYAQEYIEAGGELPGWYIGKTRPHRKWANEEEALKAFQDLGDKAFSVKILSPSQMEKIAGKERVAPLVFVPEGGPTLKRTEIEKPKKETKGKKEVSLIDQL